MAVARLMPKKRIPPSQTWRTFLDNHVKDLVSIDFFVVPTAALTSDHQNQDAISLFVGRGRLFAQVLNFGEARDLASPDKVSAVKNGSTVTVSCDHLVKIISASGVDIQTSAA